MTAPDSRSEKIMQRSKYRRLAWWRLWNIWRAGQNGLSTRQKNLAAGRGEPSKALISAREPLDEPVEIFAALEERLYGHTLVLAVGAHVVNVLRAPRMPIGRDAGIAQIAAIGGAG